MNEFSNEWNEAFDQGYAEGYADGREDIEPQTRGELARYKGALERIASRESGIWGLIASDSLRGRDHARR